MESQSADDLLIAEGVSKHYAKHTALDKVSLSIPKYSITGLLGPNGAGKTSFIRILTQITMADEGRIIFDGAPLSSKDIFRMGYLPEERGLYKKMQVGEQLLYLAQLKGLSKKEAKTRLNEWIERFEMADWWKKNIEDLSKGMQQKVQFISTVLHEPDLLILDEPFSGFDPINANLIKEEILRLREKGSTIIFSTHRMESVEELCEHVIMLHRSKKVLDGNKEEIKQQFSDRTFLLHTSQQLALPLPYGFLLIKEQATPQGILYEINAGEESTNKLLHFTLDQKVGILSFTEKMPSMQDIFIKVAGRE